MDWSSSWAIGQCVILSLALCAGWWHYHVNNSDEDAWLFPVQDAGLYTYQRTLDIRFWPREQGLKVHRGATFKGTKIKQLQSEPAS